MRRSLSHIAACARHTFNRASDNMYRTVEASGFYAFNSAAKGGSASFDKNDRDSLNRMYLSTQRRIRAIELETGLWASFAIFGTPLFIDRPNGERIRNRYPTALG